MFRISAIIAYLTAILVSFMIHTASETLNGQEIGFLEDYVLSEDREVALRKLVPGTEDYYFYHCLHYQNSRQLDRVNAMTVAWKKRFGETQLYQQIINRQMMLMYTSKPQETLSYVKQKLNLNFNHQRQIPQAQRKLPTALDPDLISTERLLKRALSRSGLERVTDEGLHLLANVNLNKTQRRQLLKRLSQPNFPNLVELIVAELQEKDAAGFGRLNIQRLLTVEQLDQLATKRPRLRSEMDFVQIYLSKLVPSEDVNWLADTEQRRKYLDRLWAFVKPLQPSFNSLKANILFQRLQLDAQQEKFDRQRFMTYLRLPRNVYYVNPVFIKNVRSRNQIAQLGSNYSKSIMLPPIADDSKLVKAYLQHFLRDAEDHREFEPYIRSNFLKEQFAETKILAGIGDVEKWASMLTPEQYKEILERVELDFAPTNPSYVDVKDEVKLDLYLKNVDKLIVKIFEVNTENYYRKFRREIDTDINLDGLVPNFEKTFEYKNDPAIRARKSFRFPEVADRGVYIVDFIAGGKSSRALIRKGRLQLIGDVDAAGHVFHVVDAQKQLVKDATLWIAGRRYQPEKDGHIRVPFSTQPGRTQAIITQGNFSSLGDFDHLAEVYRFQAALILDRENLTRTNEAQVVIRPSLQVAGTAPAPVGLLKEPKLDITTVNMDGLPTSKTLTDFELKNDSETICTFMVPPRTRAISLQLSASIDNVSKDKREQFSVNENFNINQIDLSEEIQDIHLAPTINGYFLEVLGKSGEARANQSVQVGLSIHGLKEKSTFSLQTDQFGLISLGKLDHVFAISAKPTEGKTKNWNLETQDQTYAQTIHVPAGKSIAIPAPARLTEADARHLSLYEMRLGRIVKDMMGEIKIVNGQILIKELPPGDYQLQIDSPIRSAGGRARHRIAIRVTEGTINNGVLVGSSRHLQLGNSRKVQISTISGNQKKVRIELENTNKNTRVHVIASRYQPAFNVFNSMSAIRGIEPWRMRPADRRTVYQEGRKIGDEYEYILRRKYAAKFPGNMLERPSLLLNPWSPRDTQNDSQVAASGDAFGSAGTDADEKAARARAKKRAAAGNNDFANLDFVGQGSIILTNLKPNQAGVVSIDRKKLGDNQHLRVVAVDGFDTVQRNINFQLKQITPRDARLAVSFDSDSHFSQSKQTQLLGAGDTVKVDDVVSAKFQQYDDLKDVFTLLEAVSGNSTLNEFQFILEWPNHSKEEKQELYSKHVCHELNFFIQQKDAEFFKNVVVPHLKNKRIKTFMDQYLLREDLSAYTKPWKFNQLNTVEKILLARRLEERTPDIVRHLNELYLINPTSPTVVNRYYDTSISALGLLAEEESEVRLGEKVREIEDLKRAQKRLPALAAPKAAAGFGVIAGGDSFGGGGGGRAGRSFSGKSGGKYGGGGGMGGMNGPGDMTKESKSQAMLDSLEIVSTNGAQRGRYDKDKAGTMMFRSEAKAKAAFELADQANLFVADSEISLEQLKKVRKSNRLYRRVSATKEWIESDYYRLTPQQTTPDLVRMNQFWRDFANHTGGSFLSSNFAEASESFTSMMFALSVTDLPFESGDHQVDFADNSMTFQSAGPAVVLHQQVREANLNRQDTKILVSENFYQQNDRYRYEEGIQYDKFVTDEFLAHVLYGSQVVITNPTSTPQRIELLVQIPEGSVACNGSQETRTQLFELKPFSTITFQYHFYFPTAGNFDHYPAHVSSGEEVLAVADNLAFKVVDKQAELDKTSWEFVSQNGSDDEVIDFINNENVQRLDLSKIAFRMKDKAFFKSAIEALRNRYTYHATLWSYGIEHNDLASIREYMTHDNKITGNCGIEFSSELFQLKPVERKWYGHKEYWPLVNARAHQLGPQRKILNRSFYDQYQSLLAVLAQHRELSDDDHLVLTYYLLLQDRIEAALTHFEKINKSNVNSEIQYTYCDAYLDFYRGKPETAASKAASFAEYPVDHWRKRFEAILAQAKEIKGADSVAIDDKNNNQRQTVMASKSESINLEVVNGQIKLSHQNVEQVKVNYYEMDIELLFSRSPFAQDDLDGFSMIRPNESSSMKLNSDDQGRGNSMIDLPESLDNKNVLVEVVAGDQSRSVPFFAHTLDVKMMENYGQLQVTGVKTGKVLPKTYVKVYAKTRNGQIRFHKDGYTDLRGRFDYVTQSNQSPDGIQRLSILVLSESNGALTRQAEMPKE